MARYLRALNARFNGLADDPQRRRDRCDLAMGYRSFPKGRPLVFCGVLPKGIAILGVPHQAMNVTGPFDEGW